MTLTFRRAYASRPRAVAGVIRSRVGDEDLYRDIENLSRQIQGLSGLQGGSIGSLSRFRSGTDTFRSRVSAIGQRGRILPNERYVTIQASTGDTVYITEPFVVRGFLNSFSTIQFVSPSLTYRPEEDDGAGATSTSMLASNFGHVAVLSPFIPAQAFVGNEDPTNPKVWRPGRIAVSTGSSAPSTLFLALQSAS